MNIPQSQPLHEQQPQNINDVWGVSDSIDFFEQKWLKLFKYTDNDDSTILTIVNPSTNQIEYAFHNSKIDWRFEHIHKFKLWTLRAKWHSEKKQECFISKMATKKNISIINNHINKYEKSQSSISSKEIIKNPDFPDGSYIYKNQYWKEFKVETLWWKAVNISCDNNYITWHQKGAITRAINENRLEKFEEIITNPKSDIKSCTDSTAKQVSNIHRWITTNEKENTVEKETASAIEIENTVVQTIWQIEKLLVDNLSEYEWLLKDINENLNNYNGTNDLNQSILENICMWLLIFTKTAWIEISDLSKVVNNKDFLNFYFLKLNTNIQKDYHTDNLLQDISTFTTKTMLILADYREQQRLSSMSEEEILREKMQKFQQNKVHTQKDEELNQIFKQAHRKNWTHTYTWKTEPGTSL